MITKLINLNNKLFFIIFIIDKFICFINKYLFNY